MLAQERSESGFIDHVGHQPVHVVKHLRLRCHNPETVQPKETQGGLQRDTLVIIAESVILGEMKCVAGCEIEKIRRTVVASGCLRLAQC